MSGSRGPINSRETDWNAACRFEMKRARFLLQSKSRSDQCWGLGGPVEPIAIGVNALAGVVQRKRRSAELPARRRLQCTLLASSCN